MGAEQSFLTKNRGKTLMSWYTFGTECPVCYDHSLKMNMSHCAQGHLFCKVCLDHYIDSVQDANITCFSHIECKESIPTEEIKRLLPKPKWVAFQRRMDRQMIEFLGLEQCPFCDFAAEIIPSKEEQPLFYCQTPTCKKVSCRLCRAANHAPFNCKDRTSVEEKKTESVIRSCHYCASKGIMSQFMKETGCNKMTCPKCHNFVCYQCEAIITTQKYAHFCQHARNGDPKFKCYSCTKCLLWGDSDDNRIVRAVQTFNPKPLAPKWCFDSELPFHGQPTFLQPPTLRGSCQAILKTGKNKGQKCSNKALPSSQKCGVHTRYQPDRFGGELY